MNEPRREAVGPEVASIEARLRTASDGIQLAVLELRALEAQKRAIEPHDPRFVELATRVRRSAEQIHELTKAEEAFAGELAQSSPSAVLSPIEDVPPPHDVRHILQEWREVERSLEKAPPGSPEARQLLERYEALRSDYLRAMEEKLG